MHETQHKLNSSETKTKTKHIRDHEQYDFNVRNRRVANARQMTSDW
jgi:hypothetical protein